MQPIHILNDGSLVLGTSPLWDTTVPVGAGAGGGSTPPTPVISANDFAGDVDGVLQQAMAIAAHDQGLIKLIAVSDAANEPSALGFAAQHLYYGKYGTIPMGHYTGTQKMNPLNNQGYAFNDSSGIATTYPTPAGLSGSGNNLPDAVTVMRLALSTAASQSVVIFTGAPHSTISALLNSAANFGGDGLGTGLSLITAAVKLLVVMGGDYPTAGGEFNFATDPAAANNVAVNFPRPIVFLGATFGGSLSTGARLYTDRPPNDITRYCLVTQVGSPNLRQSYDNLAFLYVIRGLSFGGLTYFVLNGPGVNSINASTGANSFTGGSAGATINYANGTGNHYYLTKGTATNTQITNACDLFIAQATKPALPTPLFFAQINESGGATTLADSGSGAHVAGVISGTTKPAIGDHYLDFTSSAAGNDGYVNWTDAQTTDLNFNAAAVYHIVATVYRTGGGTYSHYFGRNRDNAGTSGWYGLFHRGADGGGDANTVGLTAAAAAFAAVYGIDIADPGTGSWYTITGGSDGSSHYEGSLMTASAQTDATIPDNADTSGTGGNLQIGNDGSADEYFAGYSGNFRIYGQRLDIGQRSQTHFEPISATVQTAGTTIKIVMPLYLRPPYTVDGTGWFVKVNGTVVNVSAASAGGQTVTLTVPTIHSGQTVTLAYYSGATVDVGSQRLCNFGSYPVTNNSTA